MTFPAPLRSPRGAFVRSPGGARETVPTEREPPPLWSPHYIITYWDSPFVGEWRLNAELWCRNIGSPHYFTGSTLRINDNWTLDFFFASTHNPTSRCAPPQPIEVSGAGGASPGIVSFRNTQQAMPDPNPPPVVTLTEAEFPGGEGATDTWLECGASQAHQRGSIIDRPAGLWALEVQVDWTDLGNDDYEYTVDARPYAKSQWDSGILPTTVSFPFHAWDTDLGSMAQSWAQDGDLVQNFCAGTLYTELLPDAGTESFTTPVPTFVRNGTPDLSPWRADQTVRFDDGPLADDYAVAFCAEQNPLPTRAIFHYWG